MKKIVCLLLVFVSLISFEQCFFASNTTYLSNDGIVSILEDQFLEEDLNYIKSFKNDLSSKGKEEILKYPMIRVFVDILLNEYDKDYTEIISMQPSQDKYRDYIVFCEIPYRIRLGMGKETIRDAKEYVSNIYDYDLIIPSHLQYILDMSDYIEIDGETYMIKEIYLIEDVNHKGYLLYLVTDKEVFARYYDDYFSEGLLMVEKDFEKYKKEYYEYISSYEYNYDENGSPKGGQSKSFEDFVLNNPSTSDSRGIYFFLSVISLLILSLIAIHKKNKYFAE